MKFKFVVAIGYSEGGLVPLTSFFDHVPHDHATYIILRHIPIGQRNVLADILQRHSKLAIKEAEDDTPIENDVVYIPPSDSFLTIKDDRLFLHPRTSNQKNYNYSINIFLYSLAIAKREQCIAIILSGNGRDGSDGVVQIKKAGGLVLVQTPSSCEKAEMPENAIETGVVDEVLLPAKMPAIVSNYVDMLLKKASVAK